MIELIPRELQALSQWVAAGDNKVPINPRNGRNADPTDPTTWGTYEEAKRAGLKHIGFVLAAGDPYTIIDLDDPFARPDKSRIGQGDPDYEDACDRVRRHAKFLDLFDSYTELSQSGQGLHIIVKGKVPKGVRRDKVEIYSEARYMICTGRVYRDAPICERQELLDIAFREMDSTSGPLELVQMNGHLTDEEVVQMAMRASNADKFNKLCRGEWQEMGIYTSQSEADLALMTIFAFYTRDNEQVRRLFRYSALGQRDKALRDDYLNYALTKIRGKQPPLVDVSLLTPPAPVVTNATGNGEQQTPPVPAGECQIPFPPGVVGEIAQFALDHAVRPVPQIALAAGIALTAGLVGRSYNVSGTGLNQYVILLARTGSGKEAIAQVMESLISAVRMSVPMADQFVGPAAFASGQGLIKALDASPCFVSVLGEFGLTLQQLSHPRANSAEVMLKKVLLDLYGKSGWQNTLRSTVYSDKEKNTRIVRSPALTIVGESTPEAFFDGLSEEQIASGLIPRFLTLQYEGPRPPRNEQAFGPPSPALVSKLAELTSIAISTQQNSTCAPVQAEPAARKVLDDFDRYVDRQFDTDSVVAMQLWNRAHLKALKLAGLVAVGINPHAPAITADVATWAVTFVKLEVRAMLSKFASGDVGHGHSKLYNEVMRMIAEYLKFPAAKRKQYKAPAKVLELQVVPLAYLTTRARMNKSFTTVPNRTPRQVLESVLTELIDEEVLNRVPLDQAVAQFSTRTPLYVEGTHWHRALKNLTD